VKLLDFDYFPREDVDRKLNFLLGLNTGTISFNGDYTIVVGPKGSGKSTTVAHALDGKPWVKLIQVHSGLEVKEFREMVDDVLGLKSHPRFLEGCRRGGHAMTIVFDVETGPSSELVQVIRKTAKYMAINANVIIILSEAYLAMDFAGSEPRERFVWVSELTAAQATAYVAAKIDKTDKGETADTLKSAMNAYIQQVSRNPKMLDSCIDRLKEGEKIDEIISKEIKTATRDINAFQLKPIIEALKVHPEGVSRLDFAGQVCTYKDGEKVKWAKLSFPKDVAPAMKECKAIIYHYPTGEYRPYSTAHANALKMLHQQGDCLSIF